MLTLKEDYPIKVSMMTDGTILGVSSSQKDVHIKHDCYGLTKIADVLVALSDDDLTPTEKDIAYIMVKLGYLQWVKAKGSRHLEYV